MNTTAKQIELVPAPIGAHPSPSVPTTLDMLNHAVGQNASVEVLTKLMDLHDRHEKNMQRRAFDAAMADVRADLPTIVKTREVSFGNGKAAYKYEDLSAITEALSPVMAKHGLSFRWRTDTADGKTVKVTCVIAHRDGHFEETTLSAAHDTSGGKNAIQALGSALSYLARYSLKMALGVAAGVDDDGRAASGNDDGGDLITPEQLTELLALASDVGADVPKFSTYLKVASLAALPARRFQQAIDALNAKRGAKDVR